MLTSLNNLIPLKINYKKMIHIDDKNTLSSSSFLNQISHDSSFIEDRKLP